MWNINLYTYMKQEDKIGECDYVTVFMRLMITKYTYDHRVVG